MATAKGEAASVTCSGGGARSSWTCSADAGARKGGGQRAVAGDGRWAVDDGELRLGRSSKGTPEMKPRKFLETAMMNRRSRRVAGGSWTCGAACRIARTARRHCAGAGGPQASATFKLT
jgi:hypothetical protein